MVTAVVAVTVVAVVAVVVAEMKAGEVFPSVGTNSPPLVSKPYDWLHKKKQSQTTPDVMVLPAATIASTAHEAHDDDLHLQQHKMTTN